MQNDLPTNSTIAINTNDIQTITLATHLSTQI